MELDAHFEGSIEVPAPLSEVFKLLSDVPDSAAHFPELERLQPEGDGYSWYMKRIGRGKLSLQIIYSCRYEVDEGSHQIRWFPIPGSGNARCSGRWRLQALSKGTLLSLQNELCWSNKIPRIMRGAVERSFQEENLRLIRGYLENLKRSFNGGDGRAR